MNKLSILNNLDDLRFLRALYNNNYNDDNLIGFHVLDNFVKWFENEPNIKHVKVYSLNDEWRKIGLYMIVDRYGLFLNSIKPADENLRIALKLLDWSRGYKITALPEMHYQIVAETLRELNITWREVQLQVYRLPWQKATSFEIKCPLDCVLNSVNIESATILDSNFYSQQAGSLFFFKRLLTHNLSIGVYLRENNELVAWCTRCTNGFLASLFVKPAYRGRGLAKLIIGTFARKLSQLDKPADTFAAVAIQNQASSNLFKKMNFEDVTKIYHMVAFCVPSGMEWPFD